MATINDLGPCPQHLVYRLPLWGYCLLSRAGVLGQVLLRLGGGRPLGWLAAFLGRMFSLFASRFFQERSRGGGQFIVHKAGRILGFSLGRRGPFRRCLCHGFPLLAEGTVA